MTHLCTDATIEKSSVPNDSRDVGKRAVEKPKEPGGSPYECPESEDRSTEASYIVYKEEDLA